MERVNDYRPFAITKFLKDSRHWAERIKKLEQELEDLSPLPSVNNESGVRSSEPSDMTAKMALRRLEIAAEIEELRYNEEMLRYALKRLSEDERELINGFFFPKKAKGVFVWEYGRNHGMSERRVYTERDNVLRKLGDIVDEVY